MNLWAHVSFRSNMKSSAIFAIVILLAVAACDTATPPEPPHKKALDRWFDGVTRVSNLFGVAGARMLDHLSTQIREQGLDPDAYLGWDGPPQSTCNVTAKLIRDGDNVHIVLFLSKAFRSISESNCPSRLILCDQDWTVRDKLDLDAWNLRLSINFADGQTEDGADIMVMVHLYTKDGFMNETSELAPSHSFLLSYGGKKHTVRSDSWPSEWRDRGVCRVGVAGGRFTILSPPLSDE